MTPCPTPPDAVELRKQITVIPHADGFYFIRYAPDEHWLLVELKGNRVFGNHIVGGGGCRAPEAFKGVEWSTKYSHDSDEVWSALQDTMGAAIAFVTSIKPCIKITS